MPVRAFVLISWLAISAASHGDAFWVLRSYTGEGHTSDGSMGRPVAPGDLDFWEADGSFCVEDSSAGECIGVTAAEACRLARDRYERRAAREAKETGQPARYSFKCRFLNVYGDR